MTTGLVVVGSFCLVLVGAWIRSLYRFKEYVKLGKELQQNQPGSSRPASRKINLLFWKSPEQSREDVKGALGQILLNCEKANYKEVTFYYDDPENTTPSTAPPPLFPLAPRVTGLFSLGFKKEDDLQSTMKNLLRLFNIEGFARCEGYLVSESIYTDFGEYAGPATHGFDPRKTKRTWLPKERTPYPTVLTLFPMASRFSGDREAFKQQWFAFQSPMSEIMQPRIRYVRRFVQEKLTETAPDYAGIVTETFASNWHMKNPFLFFYASNPFDLIVNIIVMVRSVSLFAPISKLSQIPCGEYICQ